MRALCDLITSKMNFLYEVSDTQSFIPTIFTVDEATGFGCLNGRDRVFALQPVYIKCEPWEQRRSFWLDRTYLSL